MTTLHYPIRKVKYTVGNIDFSFTVGQSLRLFTISSIEEIELDIIYIRIYVSKEDGTATLWKEIPKRICIVESDLSIL